MRMNALVMSRNTSAVKALVTAFAEMHVEYRICFSPSETLEHLAEGRYSALVVDFDLPHALEVAKAGRAMPTKMKPVLFGMIGAGTPIAAVFQAGGNFVLYKPLDLLQVLHSFRAAESFMQKDRRRSSRQKGETLAYLQLPGGTIPALVQDLTEQGLSLQAAEALMPLRGVPLRFLLPGTTNVVKASGDFIWADKGGRAGLFFTEMPVACRRDLQAWLRKRHVKKADAVRVLLEPQKSRRAAAGAH
jgi:DNA-binding response OmpR family regulator